MPRIAVAALVAVVSFLSQPATAETLRPEPLIVSATRLADDPRTLPASVTLLDADAIAASPARTLPELLAMQAGISQRSLYGNGAARDSLDLRGFGATGPQNTLILLDGRRLNDVDLAAIDFAAIPLAAIARIEIVRGTGSVLYGDGAAGGTINIITRVAEGTGTSGKITARAGSHDTRGLDLALDHSAGSFAASVFANRTYSDGYRDNNALDQRNLLTDLRWREERSEWFVKLASDLQDLRLPGVRRVNPGAGIDELADDRRGTNTPDDYANQDGRQLTAGTIRYLPGDTRLILDAGYRAKHQESYFAAFGGSYLETDLATWSFTPRLQFRHHAFDAPGEITLGIDDYHSGYDSDRAPDPATISTPVHRLAIDQRSSAIYVQNMSAFGDTQVTAGGRIQRVTLSARDSFDPAAPGAGFESQAPDLDASDTEHAVELGARRVLSPELSVYVRGGRSLRFATVDELFEYDPATFLRVFSPLKPQTAKHLDLGGDWRRNDQQLSASLYSMDIENEIHFNPLSFTNDNLDPTRRSGLNLTAATRLATDWRVQLDYAYTRSGFREGPFAGNEVPLVARDSGALSLSWQAAPKALLGASARYTGAKRFDNDQTNTFDKIPAYTTVDMLYSQTLGDWDWRATVHNALNKKAFDYGVRSVFTPGVYNAYPLPERTLEISVTRKF